MEHKKQRSVVDDPFTNTIESAVKVGIVCGSVGFLFGGAVGIVRGLPGFFAATATGIQTFGLGTTLTFTRLTIIQAWTTEQHAPSPPELVTATTIAGGVSGASMGMLFRGRKNVLPGMLMWSIFGAVGQFSYNRWKAPKGLGSERPGFWQRMSDKSWTPFRVLSNEEYAMMLREKRLRLDVEISILEDKIVALREQESRGLVPDLPTDDGEK